MKDGLIRCDYILFSSFKFIKKVVVPNTRLTFVQSGIFVPFLKNFSKVWQLCNSHRNSGERGTAESPPERG